MTLAAVAAIAGVGVVIGAAERVFVRQAEATWIDVGVAATTAPATTLRLNSSRLAFLDRRAPTCLIEGSRAVAAGVVVLAWLAGWPVPALLGAVWVFATQLYSAARFPHLLDGSDQMANVTWGALSLAPFAPRAALVFLAAQLAVAYWAAGFSKLASSEWRDGSGLAAALQTMSFGSPGAVRLARRRSAVLTVSWMTIAFETLGPLAVVAGGPVVIAFAAVAVAFHVAVAQLMGLHAFVWAFVPAVVASLWAGASYGALGWPWA